MSTSVETMLLPEHVAGYADAACADRARQSGIDAPAVPARKSRIAAVDTLRLVASVLMIQGHVFTLAVMPSIRATRAYGYHDFVHGFTAPMFLFSAGLSFGVTSGRGSRTASTAESLRRYERYATLIALGYLLHVGRLTLARILDLDAATIRSLVVVDALPCVGVTLAIAQLLRALAPDEVRFRQLVGFAGVGIVVISPVFDGLHFEAIPSIVHAYLNHDGASLFPLFPWSGYVLLGIVVAELVGESARDAGRRTHLFGIAFVCVVSGVLLGEISPDLFGAHEYWLASPYFFLARGGALLGLLALLLSVDAPARESSPSATSDIGQRLAGETLCVYLVHLSVLYGTPFSRGIRRHVEGRLDLAEAFALFVVVGLGTTAVAVAFSWAKSRYGGTIDLVRRVGLVAVAVRFFVAP